MRERFSDSNLLKRSNNSSGFWNKKWNIKPKDCLLKPENIVHNLDPNLLHFLTSKLPIKFDFLFIYYHFIYKLPKFLDLKFGFSFLLAPKNWKFKADKDILKTNHLIFPIFWRNCCQEFSIHWVFVKNIFQIVDIWFNFQYFSFNTFYLFIFLIGLFGFNFSSK